MNIKILSSCFLVFSFFPLVIAHAVTTAPLSGAAIKPAPTASDVILGTDTATGQTRNFQLGKLSAVLDWSAWPNGSAFASNAMVAYQGQIYKCLQPYTKNSGDTPAAFAAYWSATGGGVTSYTALIDKPTIPAALADLSADATHRVVTDSEKSTWNGKANTSSFASSSTFQAAYGWSPSGTFDTTADQTITGDWAFSSGLEASNISLNLGTLTDLKIGNAQMVDDTKGNGDTNFLWSADKIFDQLATKQATLVSGTNIKTINGNSLVGSGDLTVSGNSGTSGYVALSAAPYSDVACTTGQYGYYGSTAYLCTGGFWTSKWTLAPHSNSASTIYAQQVDSDTPYSIGIYTGRVIGQSFVAEASGSSQHVNLKISAPNGISSNITVYISTEASTSSGVLASGSASFTGTGTPQTIQTTLSSAATLSMSSTYYVLVSTSNTYADALTFYTAGSNAYASGSLYGFVEPVDSDTSNDLYFIIGD